MLEERVDVRGDGRIILYKRQGLKNPKWQARIKIPATAGYKIVTTKCIDQREAERFALDLYEHLYLDVKAGGSLKSKTFRQVVGEWERSLTTTTPTRQGGSWDATIARVQAYAVDFFGSKKIRDIGRSEFAEYWVWRKRTYKRKPPSNATLRRERTSLIPVFKFALYRGYITKLPDSSPPKAKNDRRPTFTLAEWRIITRNAREWLKEGKQKATGRDRFAAFQTFLVLANTGMRVGELRGLRWGDLRTVQTKDGTRLIGSVSGKTGAREVVFQDGAEEYIKRLFDLRCEELSEEPGRDGLVICHRDGTAIQTMRRSFQSLLQFSKIATMKDGGARTIYSLRHFYATQRLSHETSPFLLAKQMGTSVEMLEKFYGQTVTSALAAELTKGNQGSAARADRSYPFE